MENDTPAVSPGASHDAMRTAIAAWMADIARRAPRFIDLTTAELDEVQLELRRAARLVERLRELEAAQAQRPG